MEGSRGCQQYETRDETVNGKGNEHHLARKSLLRQQIAVPSAQRVGRYHIQGTRLAPVRLPVRQVQLIIDQIRLEVVRVAIFRVTVFDL